MISQHRLKVQAPSRAERTNLYSLVVAVLPQQQLHIVASAELRVHPQHIAVRRPDLSAQGLDLITSPIMTDR